MTRLFLPFARPDIDEDTIAAVGEVLRSGWITSGPAGAALRGGAVGAIAAAARCAPSPPATAALEIALAVAGIGPGDEVIVPAMTFVASANVVLRVGARPVFVDVDLDTRNTRRRRASRPRITPRTQAIMPVHFAGLPVDMAPVYALAKRRGLRVIEDAAHAIGAARTAAGASARRATWCRSASTPTRTSPPSKAARSASPTRRKSSTPSGCASTASASCPAARWTSRSPAASSTCPTSAPRSASGSSRGWSNSTRAARELARRYFERLQRHPAACACRPPDQRRALAGTCSRRSSTSRALGTTRRAFIEPMHARGIGVGVHYQALHLFAAYRRLG